MEVFVLGGSGAIARAFAARVHDDLGWRPTHTDVLREIAAPSCASRSACAFR